MWWSKVGIRKLWITCCIVPGWMRDTFWVACTMGRKTSLLFILPPLLCSISYSRLCFAPLVLICLRIRFSHTLSSHATTLRLLRLPTDGLPHLHRPHHDCNGHRHHRPLQEHHTSVLRYWKYRCSVMGCTRGCPVDWEKERRNRKRIHKSKEASGDMIVVW